MNGTVQENLAAVQGAVLQACAKSGRNAGEVNLIAVSKTVSMESILCAYISGQRHFAESRLQEAQIKLGELPEEICWHFIGKVQRNKVRKILHSFPVIHSVDSLRLAKSIHDISSEIGKCPELFLEINLAEEPSKGGFVRSEIWTAMDGIRELSGIKVVGLMCIPPNSAAEDSRKYFSMLREMRDRLVESHGLPLPFLSMGMSHDFAVAIEEGATHVRIGSAIFGDRASSAAMKGETT